VLPRVRPTLVYIACTCTRVPGPGPACKPTVSGLEATRLTAHRVSIRRAWQLDVHEARRNLLRFMLKSARWKPWRHREPHPRLLAAPWFQVTLRQLARHPTRARRRSRCTPPFEVVATAFILRRQHLPSLERRSCRSPGAGQSESTWLTARNLALWGRPTQRTPQPNRDATLRRPSPSFATRALALARFLRCQAQIRWSIVADPSFRTPTVYLCTVCLRDFARGCPPGTPLSTGLGHRVPTSGPTPRHMNGHTPILAVPHASYSSPSGQKTQAQANPRLTVPLYLADGGLHIRDYSRRPPA
jgi:hypothetical protein